MEKQFFASLKSLKTGVGSVVGSGCIRQIYGSVDPDPDPHQNVTDPQHCYNVQHLSYICISAVKD
jgi:hypothetical protein